MFKSYIYITPHDAKILLNPQESRHVPSFFHHFPGTNPNESTSAGGTGRVGGHHGTELHRADGGHCGGAAKKTRWGRQHMKLGLINGD